MSDEEIQILKKINNGDNEAFRHLFNLYYRRLTIYASGYLENNLAAEDLVQDLFVDIWEKRDRLVINSSVSSYFFSAIHNRCIQQLRRIKVQQNWQNKQILKLREAEIMMNNSFDFELSDVEMKEIQKIVDNVLSALPEKTKMIFEMSRKSFLSNQEIADKLKVSLKTVEYHISKVLSKLRSALGNFIS
jgi:RNA polymerase sigma-70 factor (ECF subfamily)